MQCFQIHVIASLSSRHNLTESSVFLRAEHIIREHSVKIISYLIPSIYIAMILSGFFPIAILLFESLLLYLLAALSNSAL
ncbi:MAG TPA: hypothetical protein VJ697_12975 [Nitrososphaeraceae archaeon]|nr:hypothetical protein [Nitrososphaeraceae archaeon]